MPQTRRPEVRSRGRLWALLLLALNVLVPLVAAAQMDQIAPSAEELSQKANTWVASQTGPLWSACLSLPLAALLGAMLAYRPQRSGSPPRLRAVIHTQILLAIIGALVMLVVGSSLARAFGVVGAASLIRYRAKVSDPKDAGVMLGALGVGFATGVGLHLVALVATGFLLLVLWLIESQPSNPVRVVELTVATGDDPSQMRGAIEQLFDRERVEYELRGSKDGETLYEVRLTNGTTADALAHSILPLGKENETSFRWEEKKSSAAAD